MSGWPQAQHRVEVTCSPSEDCHRCTGPMCRQQATATALARPLLHHSSRGEIKSSGQHQKDVNQDTGANAPTSAPKPTHQHRLSRGATVARSSARALPNCFSRSSQPTAHQSARQCHEVDDGDSKEEDDSSGIETELDRIKEWLTTTPKCEFGGFPRKPSIQQANRPIDCEQNVHGAEWRRTPPASSQGQRERHFVRRMARTEPDPRQPGQLSASMRSSRAP